MSKSFYDIISIEQLRNFAKIGGLDTCCDLEKIWPLLRNAGSILEVGGGYGRAIEYLLAKGYKGELAAIEKSEQFYRYLKEQYKIKCYLFDLMESKINGTYDAIIWMWSGIMEFKPLDEIILVLKLIKALNSDGTLIIDSFYKVEDDLPFGSKKNNAQDFSEKLLVNLHDVEFEAYYTTPAILENVFKSLGYHCVVDIYQTTTGRNRYSLQIKNIFV